MKEMSKSWEEKLKESQQLAEERAKTLGNDMAERRKTTPHMVNLNKDPLMSECLAYFFPQGVKVRCVSLAA